MARRARPGISKGSNDTARDSGFAPLARPGMTVGCLRKCLNTGDSAAQDQGVDVMGAFIGVHGFQIRGVSYHVLFNLDAVAAMLVASHACDVERFAAILALDARDHLGYHLSFV